MKPIRRHAAKALVCALLFPAGRAHAAGLDVPDLGAEALGKGAADAAAPTTLMAIYYNPAGLADQGGLRFLIDARGLQETTTFQRMQYGVSNPTTYPSVTDQGNKGTGGLLIAPSFGLSYGFKAIIPWTVAIGGMPPAGYSNDEYPNYFALRSTSPATGDPTATVTAQNASPQRYTLISNTSTGYTLSATLAAQPLPFMSIGAQFQAVLYSFNTLQAISLNTVGPEENAAYDGELNVQASSFSPSGLFGVSFKLPAGIQIGASAQLPTSIDAKGQFDLSAPPSFANGASTPQITGNGVDFKITLPWTGRLGIRVDRPAFEVELDGVYEGWSMYKDITIDPHNVQVKVQVAQSATGMGSATTTTITVPPTLVPTGMTDAGSVRLGGELRPGAFSHAVDFLKIRLGLIYETSAVPIDYTSLNEVNWDRWIPTIGLGFAIWKFDVDVAYAHAFQPERFVYNSAVLQSTSPGVTPTVVGNGNYTVNINMVALSLGGHFL